MKYLFHLIIFCLLLAPLAAFSIDITREGQINVSALVPSGTPPPVIGGGWLPPDIKPPQISDIAVSDISFNNAVISWKTDEISVSQLNYGKSSVYAKTIIGKDFLTAHVLYLTGLEPDTLYHFEAIAADQSGNRSSFGDQTFKTLAKPDTEAPANVANLRATASDSQIVLQWENPSDFDFEGVKIQRNRTLPVRPDEGDKIFEGIAVKYTDTNLTNGQRYFYAVFAFDKAGNFSSGAVVSAVPARPLPPEVPPSQQPSPPVTPPVTPPEPSKEILPAEPIQPSIEIPVPTVSKDDKLAVPEIKIDVSEQKARIGAVKEKDLAKEPEIKTIEFFVHTPLTLSLDNLTFPKKAASVIAVVGDLQAFMLKLDESSRDWEAKIITPPKKGSYKLSFIINYEDGTQDVIETNLLIDPYGYIFKKVKSPAYRQGRQNSRLRQGFGGQANLESDYEEVRLEGAKVELFWLNPTKKKWESWPAQDYNQENPQITDKTGEYGFLVPPGKYLLKAEKEGYFPITTFPFDVANFVVNLNIELLPTPALWQLFFRELGNFIVLFLILLFFSVLFWRKRKKKKSNNVQLPKN